MHDKDFMLHAIKLAKKANGKTFPNPMVGAVLVKHGKIIAEGYHEKAGLPHAEIVALEKAKENAEGSSLYVSLEPCSHYGKTPPCVDSIIKHKVKEVFIAMRDPNPMVDGNGIKLLRKNGIKTKVGICQEEAENLNTIYIKNIIGK